MAETSYRLGDLAARIGGRVIGDPDRSIRGVATLERAREHDLAFLTNPRYRRIAERTRAGAVLVGPGVELPERDLLEVPHPYLALAEILEIFHPPERPAPGVSPLACVGSGVRVGEGVAVGPFAVVDEAVDLGDRCAVGAGAVIGRECVVGPDSVLMPRVVLYPRTRVGARCIIHSGVVLGGDGFGFATVDGRHRKIPQIGRVIVEDDVEIGANSAVDRGTLEDTVIGKGSKLDDLVMIAHGVTLGPDALMAAQSGIAGSTRTGARVTFAGQSGSAGHLSIGEGAVVAAKTAVFADVADRAFVAGIPAVDHRTWKRAQALIRRLPDLWAELLELRARIERIESSSKRED